MKASRTIPIALCGLALSACATASPPFNTALSTQQVMAHVINPAAVALWDKAGSVDTLAGTQIKTPTTDEGWSDAEDEAAIIAEGGNMLLLPGRVRKLDPNDQDWTKYTRQMIDLALAEKSAVVARDGQKMFDIGAQLYDDGCTACHKKYLLPFLPKT